MAFGTGDKLQVCAPRFEGIVRQHCQLGLELFPEFSQPGINTVKGCVRSFLRLRVGDLHICEDKLYIGVEGAINPIYSENAIEFLATEIYKQKLKLYRTIVGNKTVLN
jgi:hypothetical protein